MSLIPFCIKATMPVSYVDRKEVYMIVLLGYLLVIVTVIPDMDMIISNYCL